MAHPRDERKARVRRIRRTCTKITRIGRGHYRLLLVIDHQSFTIDRGGSFSQKHARWFATNLAIALNRFKFGD